MYYLDTDSSNSVLSGQEIQRLKVESEKRIIDIYNHNENHIKRILNKLYGRRNIYDC